MPPVKKHSSKTCPMEAKRIAIDLETVQVSQETIRKQLKMPERNLGHDNGPGETEPWRAQLRKSEEP